MNRKVWSLCRSIGTLILTLSLFLPALNAHAQKDDDDKPEKTGKLTDSKKPKSQRWQVSWAVDAEAKRMSAKPKFTTIAHLLKFKRPADMPGTGAMPERYKTHRIKPVEVTVWSIEGTVVNVAAEHDGDYRLIVADKNGEQVTCILPDPALVPKAGRFSNRINAARAVVVKKFKPTFEPRDVKVPVQLTGLGYFGRFNSDANKSPEGFQLHPVFSVKFPAR